MREGFPGGLLRWMVPGLVTAVLAAAAPAAGQPYAYIVGPTGSSGRHTQVLTIVNTATAAKVASVPLDVTCACINPRSVAVSPDGARAYVTHFDSGTVVVVDLASNTVIHRLPVGSLPTALIVSPDSSRLYVVNHPGNIAKIQVIDTVTLSLVGTWDLSLGRLALGLAITPDGGRLYVVIYSLGSASVVKVLDTTLGWVIATVRVPDAATGADVSPDGAFVYVASINGSAVSVISTATNTVAATIPIGAWAHDVAISPDGARAYVAADTRVSVIDTASRTVVQTIPSALNQSVSFTPDGRRALVTHSGGVRVIDTASGVIAADLGYNLPTDGFPLAIDIPRALPVPPEPPVELETTGLSGNRLTLRWRGPASGPAPTSYLLEGGATPGSVAGSLATLTGERMLSFEAPTGAFYLRLRSILGGSRSAPSNEIRVFVNTPSPPSAPENLLGLVNGSSLALAWRNTFLGGQPSSLMLDVTGSIVTSIPIGVSERFSFSGVPPGSYTLSLRSANASGQSTSSNPVTLTFPGPCSGPPATPSGFVAYRLGRRIVVVWDPPLSGPVPSGYVLSVTGAFSGSFPTADRALSGVVGPGTYNLSVTATNACGQGAASLPESIDVP